MLSYIASNKFFRKWFGDFSKEELKKFLILGLIFTFVIGIYWTMRPLKDSIFMTIVDRNYIPAAKIFSLIILFPIVILYGKAVERFPRQRMFYALGIIYSILTVLFGIFFIYKFAVGITPIALPFNLGYPSISFLSLGWLPTPIPSGIEWKSLPVTDIWMLMGWLWYVFVESYGSLMVALFWAFAADTTTPESAKRGFALTVMLGQLGAILGPMFLTPLGKNYFGNSGPTVIICGILILAIIAGIKYFISVTPKEQLVSFHGKNEEKEEGKQEPGFLEGLKLMLSNKYLLGIFGIIAIYEILATIIDFNFKAAVGATYTLETDRSKYLGDYAVWVNLVAFLCLFFGINNIQRYFGVKISLALMPFIIGGMIALFLLYGNVDVLFWIMVLVKAINYALNNPTMKQLYVPTTTDVKYKSQAWIETFGSRLAKATGSFFNLMKEGLGNYFVVATSLMALGLGAFWFLIAIYLGNKFQEAIKEKKVVC